MNLVRTCREVLVLIYTDFGSEGEENAKPREYWKSVCDKSISQNTVQYTQTIRTDCGVTILKTVE